MIDYGPTMILSMVPNTLNFMITIHGIMLEQPTFKGHPVSATA